MVRSKNLIGLGFLLNFGFDLYLAFDEAFDMIAEELTLSFSSPESSDTIRSSERESKVYVTVLVASKTSLGSLNPIVFICFWLLFFLIDESVLLAFTMLMPGRFLVEDGYPNWLA